MTDKQTKAKRPKRKPASSRSKRQVRKKQPPAGLIDHRQVIVQPVAGLIPAKRNARTHSARQVRQIANSIERFGFINPILIDQDNQVIAGHGRLAAAGVLNLKSVPTLLIDHLSPAEQRAYVIADNRLAELADWDTEILALELVDLSEMELDFDITLTGFETGQIDVLVNDLALECEPEPPVPPLAKGPAVTQLGDLWAIGPHRLLCGDATDPDSYTTLLAGRAAQLVFTDPPYNVPIQGHVSGMGQVQHDEFAMAVGEMSAAEFTAFLETVFGHLSAFSADGSIHFVCMDWRHLGEVLAAGATTYDELKNLCVWAKTNGGMGSLYRSQHELVFVFKSGTAPHTNNVQLGKHGRYRTNVWNYPGANTFRQGRDEDLAMHPTVKPVALVADAIQDCSHRGAIVLDAFAGSGTTLLAAEQTGRHGYALELDPHYCDLILRRLCEATNQEALLLETGQSFGEVAAERTESEVAA